MTVLAYYLAPMRYALFDLGAAGWLVLPAARPLLAAFLATTLYAVPVSGWVRTDRFWYCFVLHQYTGMWPASNTFIRKSAAPKLVRRVPMAPTLTIPPPAPRQTRAAAAAPPDAKALASQFQAAAFETIAHRRHLNFRSLPLHAAKAAVQYSGSELRHARS